MLARYVNKEQVDVILNTDSLLKMHDFFWKNPRKKYLVVTDIEKRPKGIIQREDIVKFTNATCLMDYVTKRLVVVEEHKSDSEVEHVLFTLIKEKINIIVLVDKDGIMMGVMERKETDVSDFYKKYSYIKQVGGGIALQTG